MSDNHVTGLPGVQDDQTAAHRRSVIGHAEYLNGGGIIDGARSTDAGNGVDTDVLRAGQAMFRDPTTKRWLPAIAGNDTAAYTSGGTELTVSAETATNLLDSLGGAAALPKTVGVLGVTGGAVVLRTATVSAIDTVTGVVTIADLGTNIDAGAVLLQGTFVTDSLEHSNGYAILDEPSTGIQVSDRTRKARIDVQFPMPVIGGVVDGDQLLGWPSDAVLAGALASVLARNTRLMFDQNVAS